MAKLVENHVFCRKYLTFKLRLAEREIFYLGLDDRPKKKRKKRGEWRKDADYSWGQRDLTDEEAGIRKWLCKQ